MMIKEVSYHPMKADTRQVKKKKANLINYEVFLFSNKHKILPKDLRESPFFSTTVDTEGESF